MPNKDTTDSSFSATDKTQTEGGCPVPPSADWSTPEKWTWRQICSGRAADFNKDLGELAVDSADGWSESRLLSPSFLESILLDPSFRDALHRQGVQIVGAWFKEVFDFQFSNLTRPLWLDRCRFESRVDLSEMRCGAMLSLEKSMFKHGLRLMRTKVDGPANLNGIICEGSAELQGICTSAGLYLEAGVELADMTLLGAKIGGELSLKNNKCFGEVNLQGVDIGAALLMNNATFSKAVDLRFSSIKKNLNLNGARISRLDLTESVVQSLLGLGGNKDNENICWAEESQLVLRNARVGAIHIPVPRKALPSDLDMDGLTYERLGGLSKKAEQAMMDRPAKWFVDWLAIEEPYTPQPYHQLANAMRSAGYPEKADAILYAGKDRELSEAWKNRLFRRAIGLQSLKWIIGFGLGYRFFRAVYWVLLLTIIGVLVLQSNPEEPELQLATKFAFSFDQLLPIIELDARHGEISLNGWRCYYFYFHKLMGYVLAFFVVAGLSGIARK